MRDRRKSFRIEWNSPAMMYDFDGSFACECIVSNFSNGGAKITGVEPTAIPDEFMLRISPHSRAHRCRVAWRSKDSLGVAFADVIKSLNEAALGRRRKRLAPA